MIVHRAVSKGPSLQAQLRAYEAGRSFLRLIDDLAQSDAKLRPHVVKKAQIWLIEDMLSDHRPAPEVQRTLTEINKEMYRRFCASIVDRMLMDGWGELPIPLSVIVMGSGGRGENYLFSDQDNGFILGDYPDSEHLRLDGYFRQLAERLCRRLDAAGLPYCNGYCMAVNPLWRKTRSQWVKQLSLWMHKRNFVALRFADIFFDFTGVAGDPSLAMTLRRTLTRQIGENQGFLRQMLGELTTHKVALGFFGDLALEKETQLGIGKIDLKHAGIVPLVEAVRLVALLDGIEETSTLGRIDALRAAGKLDEDEAEDLSGAFHVITDLILRKEISDFRFDHRVTYDVYPDAMRGRDRLTLVDSLRTIRRFRRRLRHQLLDGAL